MESADALLHRAVDADGNVDYSTALSGLELNDALHVVATADLEGMNQADAYAFLLNAYNIATLDCVRRRLWNRGAWATLRNPLVWLWFFFFTPVRVAGRKVSLYGLEFKLIKPHLRRDPRGHFALVCASCGCPPLRGGVFHGDNLEAELDQAAASSCQPGSGYTLDREQGVLRLNRIFKWYKQDFETTGGIVETWARHAPVDDAKWVHDNAPRVTFLRYDWSLNQSRRP